MNKERAKIQLKKENSQRNLNYKKLTNCLIKSSNWPTPFHASLKSKSSNITPHSFSFSTLAVVGFILFQTSTV